MPATEERVQISLPKSLVERLGRKTSNQAMSLDAQVEEMVEKCLEASLTYTERFDRLSDMYRARLAREGKLDQSFEEVMEELAHIREQVANERYPD